LTALVYSRGVDFQGQPGLALQPGLHLDLDPAVVEAQHFRDYLMRYETIEARGVSF